MRVALASLLLGFSLISTGCTEVLTYANKSRDAKDRLVHIRRGVDRRVRGEARGLADGAGAVADFSPRE